MDKVIIYGIYHFLGFSLCLQLLEGGIQVDGYRLTKSNCEEFLDDKKFMIGRNANYVEKTEISMDGIGNQTMNDEAVIVISFYDLYFSEEGKRLSSYKDIFDDILKRYSQDSITKVECLFPNSFLFDSSPSVKEIICSLKNNKIPLQFIFIPTIFGPWQPSTFFYQKNILKQYQNLELTLDERESTKDALFITDVVEEIVRQMRSSETKSIQLVSDVNEKWLQGAKYLQVENLAITKTIKKEKQVSLDVHKLIIPEKTSLKEGIDEQKRHLSRLIKHI
jgi:hypothetical protein